jgi:hypothetical protein
MILNVNGKDIEFNFGVGFMRKADKKYEQEINGIKFGIGAQQISTLILTNSTTGLLDTLGLAGEVSQSVLDNWFDSLDSKQVDEIFDQVKEALRESTATGKAFRQAEDLLRQQE